MRLEKRHWRLPGFSSTPALPLHIGPSVLEEGLGAGGLHTAKGSSSESSVRGKRRATAGLLQRFLGRPDKAPQGEHQVPRAPGWVLHPHTPRG